MRFRHFLTHRNKSRWNPFLRLFKSSLAEMGNHFTNIPVKSKGKNETIEKSHDKIG